MSIYYEPNQPEADPLRIDAIQIQTELGKPGANVSNISRIIRERIDLGAGLIVLPKYM